MINVTVVTAPVADVLSDDDYRDIYAELRQKCSLDAFVAAIGSRYSKALWSKYERGIAPLNHEMRQELRAAVGLPALPVPVADALSVVDPAATVWQIGEGPVSRVVMAGQSPDRLQITINGTCSVEEMASERHVTAVTRRRNRRTISLPADSWERLNEARLAAGETWREFLEGRL